MAVLPLDITFDNASPDPFHQVSPADYELETTASLQDIFSQVADSLKLSKEKMQRYYNRNIRFIDYQAGDKVWLKVKHYKTGENRKLAPRRDGHDFQNPKHKS